MWWLPFLVFLSVKQAFALTPVNEMVETLDEIEVSASTADELDLGLGQPVTALVGDKLTKKVTDTLGATLEQEVGLNNASFGPGVGQPVIRGQSGPRVQVLQDGLNIMDASQFSGDHANAIEPVLAEKLEVIRGPSTLLYGGTAIGGAVNVIDNRVPMETPEHPLTGALSTRFNSVSNETSTAMKWDVAKDHLVMHLDGFYRQNGNLTIPGNAINQSAYVQETGSQPSVNTFGYLANTMGNAIGGTAGLSWVDSWGYTGASYNNRNDLYGIPPNGSAGSPNVSIYQNVSRSTYKTEVKDPFGGVGKMTVRFAYNDYTHVELNDGVTNTTYTNDGAESRVELEHLPWLGGVTGVFGFQSQNNHFNVVSAPGSLAPDAPAIAPLSYIQNYSIFDLERFSLDPIQFEGGFRVERSAISTETTQAKTLAYLPVSGSFSALYKISTLQSSRISLTRSQRAPQIQELFFNGYHDATGGIEIGNSSLSPETSYNLDLGYQLKNEWMVLDLSLFQNWFDNYIFLANTGILADPDFYPYNHQCSEGGSCAPVYNYSQQSAIFRGYELTMNVPLWGEDWGVVDIDLFSDYTRGQFSQGGNVPRMPPLRYGLQLNYGYEHFEVNARLTRAQPQNDAGAYEATTPGYVLLNLNAQYRLKSFESGEIFLFLKANNLLDETIRNSVSYFRNIAPQPGRGGEVGLQIHF